MDNASTPAQGTHVPAAQKSHLRTLLVCDLADSTALVERLGDRDAATLIQRHDGLARNLVERHQGLEIDKTDGFLLLFEQPGRAVAYALEYQRELGLLSRACATSLRARVGIHMGNVVIWENSAPAVARGAKPVEVEGLAKPTAARLAQLALPGQILVSAAAASPVRSTRTEAAASAATTRWQHHGRYRLKGLPEPIDVFEVGSGDSAPMRAPASGRTGSRMRPAHTAALIVLVVLVAMGAAIGIRQWRARTAIPAPRNSIVVLPFVNLGNDPAQRYFSDGITVELTDALGKDTGLSVIAWETASRYANDHASPAEIGRKLNVANILGGSIQRNGDTVRVTAELVSTASGRQIWSARYDGSLKNIFAVEDKISAAIANALKVQFAGLQPVPTGNPQAHDLYLKGLMAVQPFTPDGASEAARYFRAALQLDPDYADAWAALALDYNVLTQVSTLPIQDALPKMRAAAHKALALDPRNAKALVALGLADGADNRIDQAKARFRQALAIDPNNVAAHIAYGNILPLDQALVHERIAARLDPDSVVAQNNLAAIYQDLSDWPQVVQAASALNRLAPHYIDTAFGLAFAYTRMQRGQAAVKAFDRVEPATALDQQLVDAGRLAYLARLQPTLHADALTALDELRRKKLNPHALNALAQLYLVLGQKPAALQLLSRVCTAVPVGCADLAFNPVFEPLHDSPRFAKLAAHYTTVTLH